LSLPYFVIKVIPETRRAEDGEYIRTSRCNTTKHGY